jgi:hypothetical protein
MKAAPKNVGTLRSWGSRPKKSEPMIRPMMTTCGAAGGQAGWYQQLIAAIAPCHLPCLPASLPPCRPWSKRTLPPTLHLAGRWCAACKCAVAGGQGQAAPTMHRLLRSTVTSRFSSSI